MKYSVVIRTGDIKYLHRSGITKDDAERIANLLNQSYVDPLTKAFVLTDEEAKRKITPDYFVVLEDGNVIFIEITPQMNQEIEGCYEGEIDDYFAEVVCEKYNIAFNNCQWTVACELGIAYYGKKPKFL